MTHQTRQFVFDRLLDAENFCNFSAEKKILKEYIKTGACVKIYGPRNYGKTSLLKNILGKEWEAEDPSHRVFIYADLFSVQSLEDISQEISKAFTAAFNSKKNLVNKSLDWMKAMKNLRPTWSPTASSDFLGQFSIALENPKENLGFQTVFENINILNRKKHFEFLIVLDEFQEITRVKKAEALLRGTLQELSSDISVIILGSKQHLLAQIFEKPRAPFYSWGYTMEFKDIAFNEYTKYINQRFIYFGLSITEEDSEYLQTLLHRIPESINRFCDYLCKRKINGKINKNLIDTQFAQFVDLSRSAYELQYASLTYAEQKFITQVAKNGTVEQIFGKNFLSKVPGLSKSNVTNVVKRLLDLSVISQTITKKSEKTYWVTDPFFSFYAKTYK
jgi:AAA+ ATPase superfamily predicted ATPase